MKQRVKEKVVVVAGAASKIGQNIAILFAEEGASLVIADSDTAGLNETFEILGGIKGEEIQVELDPLSTESWQKLVDEAVEKFGRIDVLVNAFDQFEFSPVSQFSNEMLDGLFAGVVKSKVLGIERVVPKMMDIQGGSIINLASVSGTKGIQMQAGYGMMNAAVINFAKHAAVEYANYNIRVNTVVYGLIRGSQAITAAEEVGLSEDDMAWSLNPLGRVGTATDLANAVVFLASDDSMFVTGQEIVIDGGQTAR